MKKTAVFSGSFDPVTTGHMDLITRALKLFDELHIVIAQNPDKKCFFDDETRLRMLAAAVNEYGLGYKTVCEIWDRPVFEYCRKIGAEYIIKGVRSAEDYEYEKVIASQTSHLCPGIETVLLFSDPSSEYISSTYVRGLIGYGLPLNGAVPMSVARIIDNLKN